MSIEVLQGVVVRERKVIPLKQLVEEFKIPKWHPCPCSEGEVTDELGKAHLERLLDTGKKAVLPVLVIGNYILTSTCLPLMAMRLGVEEVLNEVKVEVWSLGEYREEDKFAVMALTAELCRVHEDKGDKDIKLDFTKELLKAYAIDIATKYGSEQALKAIDELARGIHTTELAKVITRYVKVTQRTMEYYITILTHDKNMINELKQLIMEKFGAQPNLGVSPTQPVETQNTSASHDETLRGVFHRETRESTKNRGSVGPWHFFLWF